MNTDLLVLLITGPAVLLAAGAFASGWWMGSDAHDGGGKALVIVFTALAWLIMLGFAVVAIGSGFVAGVQS